MVVWSGRALPAPDDHGDEQGRCKSGPFLLISVRFSRLGWWALHKQRSWPVFKRPRIHETTRRAEFSAPLARFASPKQNPARTVCAPSNINRAEQITNRIVTVGCRSPKPLSDHLPGSDDPKDHPDEAERGSNYNKPFQGSPSSRIQNRVLSGCKPVSTATSLAKTKSKSDWYPRTMAEVEYNSV